MVPAPSHYYATFGLARHLRMLGYQIVYSGTPDCREVVEKEDFTFRSLCYVEEFVIRGMRTAAGLFLKTLLDPSYTRERYRSHWREIQAVKQLIAQIDPVLVFLDDTMSHYYPYLPPFVKVMQLSTKLSPRKHSGIPPLDSFWRPQNRPLDQPITELQWYWHVKKRRIKQLVQRIVFMGKDDQCFRERYAKRNGLRFEEIFEEHTAFDNSLKNIPAIVLASFRFEFPWQNLAVNEHHLHFGSVRAEDHAFNAEFQQVWEACQLKRSTERVRLVYVSLGTLAGENFKKSVQFLQKVNRALDGLASVEVIVSTGKLPFRMEKSGANMHWLPVVPQLHILSSCDLVITHGGFNTVKECLEAGVPMLVYPLNEQVDQPGNAARVVSHGAGLRGNKQDSAATIRRKVLHLLDNPVYRTQCQRMQRLLQQEDGAAACDELLVRMGLLTEDLAKSE